MPDKIAKINVTSYNSNTSEVTLESPLSFEELTTAVDNASSGGGGGGGSAPFEVTFEDHGPGTGWTADKTFADILAAIATGPVYGVVVNTGNVKCLYPLSGYSDDLIEFTRTALEYDDVQHAPYVDIEKIRMPSDGTIYFSEGQILLEG